MEQFHIVIFEEANNYILGLSNTIMYKYEAPITAIVYIQGLLDEIKKLKIYADSFPIQKSTFFKQYGFNVRRLNYKKMTVIYTLIDNTAYIQRVIASSTISD